MIWMYLMISKLLPGKQVHILPMLWLHWSSGAPMYPVRVCMFLKSAAALSCPRTLLQHFG